MKKLKEITNLLQKAEVIHTGEIPRQPPAYDEHYSEEPPNNSANIQLAALWLIVLVVSIPFVSAETTLQITHFSGADNIDGASRSPDTFSVTAIAKVDGESQIDKTQLKVFHGSAFAGFFDSCQSQSTTASANTFQCTYTEPILGNLGNQEYQIKLARDDGSVAQTQTRTLIVDGVRPKVTELIIDPTTTQTGNVDITWRAQDYAATTGVTTSCIGLKEITFKIGSTLIHKETPAQTCDVAGEFSFIQNTTSSSQSTENITICAIATDKFNQQSPPLCSAYTKDNQPPIISAATVTNTDGSAISFVRGNQNLAVNIAVPIDGANSQKVTADFSSIAGAAFADVQPTTRIGTTFVWRSVPVQNWNNCQFTIRATDNAENTATQQLQCGVRVDNTGPQVLSLTTDTTENNQAFLGTNSTIIASLLENGVGLANGNIFLDGFNIGLSGSIRANNCTRTGDNWECAWRITPQGERAGLLSVTRTSGDDVGNTLTQTTTNTLSITTTTRTPSNVHIINRTVFHADVDFGSAIVNTDTIEWRVQATDFTQATADFTSIGGPPRLPGSCEVANGISAERTCIWRIAIARSGPYTATPSFTFRNGAGNPATVSDSFLVSGVLNEQNPNRFTSIADCKPSFIDRATASLIPMKVFCSVKLNGNAVPFATELGPISQCTGTTSGFIGDVQLINSKAPIRNGIYQPFTPVIGLTLQQSEFRDINEINITCPLLVVATVGSSIASPETEQVHMTIQLRNSPLNDMVKARDDKIKEAVDDAQNYLEWVGVLRTFFKYAELICNIIGIFYNLVSTLTAISALFGGTAGFLIFIPPLKAAQVGDCLKTDGVRQAVNNMVYGIGPEGKSDGSPGAILHKFCSFVNCQIGLWNIFGNDKDGETPPDKIYQTLSFGLGGKQSGGAIPFDPQATVNVKESFVWSAINLCIPGIIYNLDKLRQIKCRYALCMTKDVRNGYPESTCENLQDYLTCRFWTGESFRFLPLTALLDYYTGLVRGVFQDPVTTAGVLSGYFLSCDKACIVGPQASIPCQVIKAVAAVGQSIKDITNIANGNTFEVSNDWCDQLDSEVEDQKKANDARNAGTEGQTDGVSG